MGTSTSKAGSFPQPQDKTEFSTPVDTTVDTSDESKRRRR